GAPVCPYTTLFRSHRSSTTVSWVFPLDCKGRGVPCGSSKPIANGICSGGFCAGGDCSFSMPTGGHCWRRVIVHVCVCASCSSVTYTWGVPACEYQRRKTSSDLPGLRCR